ncbi:MAG: type II toxin-antitoxin system Phd/YefM family antitoxin [Solirubrobacteraceae bacterium]
MREIGVRELKGALSETLRAVERGDQVRVTVRGRAIADIVPAGAAAGDDRVRALVAAGRLTPPASARPKRAPRLVKAHGIASALVIGERNAER